VHRLKHWCAFCLSPLRADKDNPSRALHGLVVGYPLLQSRFQRDPQNGRRREQKTFKPLLDYLKLFLGHDTSKKSNENFSYAINFKMSSIHVFQRPVKTDNSD
jgi:hypothetical protein